MMGSWRFVGAVAFVLGAATAASGQSPAAGRIKMATGEAFIVRTSGIIPAQPGLEVYESDGLRTGPDGRLAVTLKDDTRVSLDPGTEVHLDRFAYAPADGRLGLVLKVVRGLIAYVSGQIARLSRDAIRLETPDAVVGIRGTHLVIRVEPK
jgi:hypothetical protein